MVHMVQNYFTEENVDQAIELTKKAGLKYLYHYGKTFENWGHFDLYKGEFPNGIASLKNCVEKAEAQGIMVGTHFLSTFILNWPSEKEIIIAPVWCCALPGPYVPSISRRSFQNLKPTLSIT